MVSGSPDLGGGQAEGGNSADFIAAVNNVKANPRAMVVFQSGDTVWSWRFWRLSFGLCVSKRLNRRHAKVLQRTQRQPRVASNFSISRLPARGWRAGLALTPLGI